MGSTNYCTLPVVCYTAPIMKIDLHVHSKELSQCAGSSDEEMIQAAIENGLDAIVFTNHDRLVTPARLEAFNKRYAPFRIFGGIEISLETEHTIVLGIHDPALEIGSRRASPEDEPTRWEYPDLHRFVRKHKGFLILCHPFRYRSDISIDIERYPPDAIEVASHNTPIWAEAQIREIAKRVGAKVLSNSDAHVTKHFGYFYNQLMHTRQTLPEIVAALKAGEFTTVRRSAPLVA
ncbi:MAG: PHP domain-containing protein [Anaerolineae bacterium]|nr:PHP domain-containing protein [Anaerolineae bacterium]